MLNWVFLILIGAGVLCAAFTGTMKSVTDASLSSARSAVELAIALVGQMGLWLGFMRVLQDAGATKSIARALAPVMRRLFPDVPAEHPAMSAMIMNLSANVLGLGNAATPFGLKAMVELEKLNQRRTVATNSMVLFLAINTSGVAVLPLGAIAIRASLGSIDPAGIILPSLLATSLSTIAAILAAKTLQRWALFSVDRYPVPPAPPHEEESAAATKSEETKGAAGEQPEEIRASPWRRASVVAIWIAIGAALAIAIHKSGASGFAVVRDLASSWLLPLLMLAIVSIGYSRKIRVYESFLAGAKEALNIALMVFPFLLAILVAIGMFRASGAMTAVAELLSPITEWVGLPAEALPMALIRPLSGTGAMAVMTEAMKTHGPDSLIGNMVSIMNGASETTFYVLAVYLGAVGIRASRHAVAACLCAEMVGMSAAVALTHLFF